MRKSCERGRGPRTRLAGLTLASALWLGPGSPAGAAPLVEAGGKPGLVTAWSDAGSSVTLEVAAGTDPAAVASTVTAGVPGARAEVAGGKVVVRGVPLAKLVPALEGLQLEAADDVDAMLTELRSGGEQGEGSGSSIRATSSVDLADAFEDPAQAVTAKVLRVERGQFPLAKVTLQVTAPSPAQPELKRGAKLVVVPRVKSRGGVVDPEDRRSRLNVGAWYAQPGDVVRVLLEGNPKGDVWVAEAFERKTSTKKAR